MKAEHRSLDDWLEDLLTNAEKIIAFTGGLSFEQFAKDEPVRDLVQKKIENMGEATKYVRDLHPDFYQTAVVPWRNIIAMRNRLTHGYFDLSPMILWDTAREDVPELLAELRRAVELYRNTRSQ